MIYSLLSYQLITKPSEDSSDSSHTDVSSSFLSGPLVSPKAPLPELIPISPHVPVAPATLAGA